MSEFNLSAWALRNRSVIAFFMIIAVAAGLASYFRLGRSEDPSFIIKTMVVQAAWPGASVEDTLKQVTERLERKLQETPKLDFLRSYTRAGVTTIFVNLLGSTTAREVPDIWYHVRKSVGDIRQTLPAGILGPGFNDDFGDTFGIIYGFTADGFTHRELRDYVEEIRSKLSKGQFFGEKAILEERRRTATVVSRTPMVVYTLGKEDFRTALAASEPFRKEVEKVLFQRQ